MRWLCIACSLISEYCQLMAVATVQLWGWKGGEKEPAVITKQQGSALDGPTQNLKISCITVGIAEVSEVKKDKRKEIEGMKRQQPT